MFGVGGLLYRAGIRGPPAFAGRIGRSGPPVSRRRCARARIAVRWRNQTCSSRSPSVDRVPQVGCTQQTCAIDQERSRAQVCGVPPTCGTRSNSPRLGSKAMKTALLLAAVTMTITGEALAADHTVDDVKALEGGDQGRRTGRHDHHARRQLAGHHLQLLRRRQEGQADHPSAPPKRARRSSPANRACASAGAGSWSTAWSSKMAACQPATPSRSVASTTRGPDNCRITNCAFIDYNPPAAPTENTSYLSLWGTNNRVDHCYFRGKNSGGPMLVVWVEETVNHHRIDHNYFAGRPPLGRNGGETMRIGTSEVSLNNSRTIVEQNYFQNLRRRSRDHQQQKLREHLPRQHLRPLRRRTRASPRQPQSRRRQLVLRRRQKGHRRHSSDRRRSNCRQQLSRQPCR